MMAEILLYSEVNILCIAVLLIIAFDIKRSAFNKGLRPTLLLKYIGCVTVFYMIDVFGKLVNLKGVSLPNFITWSAVIAYFLIFSFASYYWLIYSEVLHNRQLFYDKKRRIIAAIPLFVVTALFAVSCFNGCIFYVDDDGMYHRGKWFYIQTAISYGYFFVAGIKSFYYAIKFDDESKKKNLKGFTCYSIITFLCGLAQFWSGGFPMLIIGNTLSILTMYLKYTGKMISNDPLTEIPNRRKLMHYLSENVNNLKSNEELWFMFADIDHFKQINDKYGHIEGDRILKEFTIVVKDFCRANDCFCARFGGDEFALVQKLNKEKMFTVPNDLKEFADKRNILVNDEQKLTVSMGYTKFYQDDYSINDMIKRADEEMYNVKMSKTSEFGGGGNFSWKLSEKIICLANLMKVRDAKLSI